MSHKSMNRTSHHDVEGAQDNREFPTRESDVPDLHELLTVEDVARLLHVDKTWVYEHTRARGTNRADRLPRIKIGKYVRFDRREVHAYLAKRAKCA